MDKARGYIYRNDGDMRAHEFFLYSLVRGVRPKRILEIGVRDGVSTLAMTQAVHDGNVAVDYHVCDIDSKCLLLQPQLPLTINFHIQPSDDLALEWKFPIDLLLIDGCHEYSQVYRDFTNYLPFITTGGFVLFHDTNPSDIDKHPGACWDAYRILDDLRKLKLQDVIEYITLPYSYGLTVVRVTGPAQ